MGCHFHEGSNAPSGHGRIGREENGRDNDDSLNLPHVHPRRASKGHSGDRRRCEERIKQPISVVSSSTGPTTQLRVCSSWITTNWKVSVSWRLQVDALIEFELVLINAVVFTNFQVIAFHMDKKSASRHMDV